MLVTRIIGDCPKCKSHASFGNVFISHQTLTRGCMHCDYSQEFWLPELSKHVIYLDQSFLSHSFRAELSDYVDCAKLLSQLASDQLIVCPISSIHETETHQWRQPQQQELWSFVKRTSRGHSFVPAYQVRSTQIYRAFNRFLENASEEFPLISTDVLEDDVNQWENYFWIDVSAKPFNIELTRKLKEESAVGLVDLFPKWRENPTNFEDHWTFELRTIAQEYFRLYATKIQQLTSGNLDAAIFSPIDSTIVETLVDHFTDDVPLAHRFETIAKFFQSKYFAEVPYEFIATGLMTVLRDRVKRGQFQNLEKAKREIRGIFFDHEAIATYAPYCHAFFLDSSMLEMIRHEKLDLEGRFPTKFFAKSNLSEFISYLESIASEKTKELSHSIDLVYPASPKDAKA